MNFSVIKNLPMNLGRAGILETPHGSIHTPAFVTVGTKATVKALTPEQVQSLGAEVVLANTYHLYLEPGSERIKSFGGLHRFMNWPGPMMTDSGGFQVFSLGAAWGKNISKIASPEENLAALPSLAVRGGQDSPPAAQVGQDGVSFRSHLDGSLHYITPEKSIQIQHDLGADSIFAFDECTSPTEDFRYQEEALERTHRWAVRCLEHHKKLEKGRGKPPSDIPRMFPSESMARISSSNSALPQALFGIVQGGREEVLRKRSAEFFAKLDFDGFGIGGSFAKEDMSTAVRWVNGILPREKPRHLLGIGEPEDLFMGVENGVDLFDCVAPTRLGRTGTLYTSGGKINITNTEYRDDHGSIDPECDCDVCKSYTRGYIAHLYRSKEILAATLGSMHNLYFIINLVKHMRESILAGNFHEFKNEFLSKYKN